MAAGPAQRLFNGQQPGWTGHVRSVWDTTTPAATVTPSDATVYDPPLRLIVAGGAGTLVLVLDANDGATAGNRFTITVTANERIGEFAIRQVRAASTATGLLGFI